MLKLIQIFLRLPCQMVADFLTHELKKVSSVPILDACMVTVPEARRLDDGMQGIVAANESPRISSSSADVELTRAPAQIESNSTDPAVGFIQPPSSSSTCLEQCSELNTGGNVTDTTMQNPSQNPVSDITGADATPQSEGKNDEEYDIEKIIGLRQDKQVWF